jgi:hypothetical protein
VVCARWWDRIVRGKSDHVVGLGQEKESMRIDLWTKEMPVDENIFFIRL